MADIFSQEKNACILVLTKKFPNKILIYWKKIFDRAKYWKSIENLENLGCTKIKGARNGSDAQKFEGRERWKFGGARTLEARKFKGVR